MKNLLSLLLLCAVQFGYAQDITTFPYFTGFEGVEGTLNENFPDGWTSEDLNTVDFGNQGWQIIKNSALAENAHTDSTAVHMFSHSTQDNDDWLFTPSIEMVQGATYTLSFWYKVNLFPGTSENLEVYAGTGSTAATMSSSSPIWSETGISSETYQEASMSFTAPADGIYYFAFHYFSPSFQFMLLVDDVTIHSDISSSIYTLEVARDYSLNFSVAQERLSLSRTELKNKS